MHHKLFIFLSSNLIQMKGQICITVHPPFADLETCAVSFQGKERHQLPCRLQCRSAVTALFASSIPNVIYPSLSFSLLLSARDCAKSLVRQAGTVSRVHVSSWSGGLQIDESACPEPNWGGREEVGGGRRWEGEES